jgi:membrane protease YdiL (CAAX protease family)
MIRYDAPAASVEPQFASDDRFARALRGFGPVGLLAIAVILLPGTPISAVLVLAWVHLSRTPWADIGYARPRSWLKTVAIGATFGVVFKLMMKAIVMPLFGTDPINQTFHYLAGNSAAVPGFLFMAAIVAPFGEETVMRGYFFERLRRLLGSSVWAMTFMVTVTAVAFGLAHYSLQGIPGVQQSTIVGLVYGTIVAVTGRIWIPMIAHAAFNATAVAIIYWDLESEIAHLLFAVVLTPYGCTG